MALQTLPPSADAYAAAQHQEIGAATSAVARLWRRVGDDFDGSYAAVSPLLIDTLDLAQERITAGALDYVPAVMGDLGMRVPDPEYDIASDVMVGTDGAGFDTSTLGQHAVIMAKQAVSAGSSAADALAGAGQWLTASTGTLLSDTGRTVEKMAGHSRHVTRYVRMLTPPSCGRCIILGGQVTTNPQPFQRHPKCDCRNVPANENVAGDLTTDPREYLDSLDSKGLARALGSQANAQAYTDGADMNQLINAYRRSGGVQTAQVYGQAVKYTTEGATRHGVAGRAMRNAGLTSKTPRLMPESIYKIATSREDAIRLLGVYGWLG